MIENRVQLLEELSDLEHRQWMKLTKYYAESDEFEVSDKKLDHWRSIWKPYSELSGEQKDKDRKWGRKVLNIIEEAEGVELNFSVDAPDLPDQAEIVSFEGKMGSLEFSRLQDRIDEARAERKDLCIDVSNVSFISKRCARTLYSSGFPMRLSETVRDVISVISDE